MEHGLAPTPHPASPQACSPAADMPHPLLFAAKWGRVDDVQRWVEGGGGPVDAPREPDGATALFVAARGGHVARGRRGGRAALWSRDSHCFCAVIRKMIVHIQKNAMRTRICALKRVSVPMCACVRDGPRLEREGFAVACPLRVCYYV